MNPLRGQNNVQGSCDMGSFPHELSGYRHVSDDATRAACSRSSGACTLDPEPGLRIPNMFDAAVDGTFKGLYIQGEDILQSDPDTKHVPPGFGDGMRRGAGPVPERDRQLRACVPAGLHLPGEERHLHQCRAAHPAVRKVMAPMNGYADWEVTQLLANALGYPMHYNHPSEIMDEIARLTPTFAGVSYEKLDELGSVQWPCNDAARRKARPIMHIDGFVRGKGKFVSPNMCRPTRRPARAFRCCSPPGRILSAVQCRRADPAHRQRRLARGGLLEIHPHDAENRGISDGDWVRSPAAPARRRCARMITERVAPGVVYTTFHHPTTQANVVTTDFSDWATNCPEYKVTAVQVMPSNGPSEWQEEYEELTRQTRQIAEPLVAAE